MSTISKPSTFQVPKFSQSFSPLPFRWVLFAGLGPWGHNFPRAEHPLHLAAANGHVSVLERLIEAKAAVDAKDLFGRGLGGGFGGGRISGGNVIFTWGSGWNWSVVEIAFINVLMVYQDKLVALLYLRLVRFLHLDVLLRNRTLELDSFLSKISACQ